MEDSAVIVFSCGFIGTTGEGLSKEENALFRIAEAEGEETATIELTDINQTAFWLNWKILMIIGFEAQR